MSPQLTVTPELKTLLRRVKLGRCFFQAEDGIRDKAT